MGFLKKIFGKKVGGTKVGNFFRGFANKINKNWGTGKNMKVDDSTQTAINLQNNSAAQLGGESGAFLMETVANTVSQGINNAGSHTAVGQTRDVVQSIADKVGDNVVKNTFMNTLKKYWYVPVGIVVLVIGWFIFKPKTTGRRK